VSWELGYDGAWGCGIRSWDMMIRFGSGVKDLILFLMDVCMVKLGFIQETRDGRASDFRKFDSSPAALVYTIYTSLYYTASTITKPHRFPLNFNFPLSPTPNNDSLLPHPFDIIHLLVPKLIVHRIFQRRAERNPNIARCPIPSSSPRDRRFVSRRGR